MCICVADEFAPPSPFSVGYCLSFVVDRKIMLGIRHFWMDKHSMGKRGLQLPGSGVHVYQVPVIHEAVIHCAFVSEDVSTWPKTAHEACFTVCYNGVGSGVIFVILVCHENVEYCHCY